MTVPLADLVLVDELRLGAGFAAEGVGLPWVSYTHHYFDEADISEAMVHYLCQCFGRSAEAVDVFEEWWRHLREGLGLGPELRGHDPVCWWNQSALATLVLGLPELKVHARPAPDYVHRVGRTGRAGRSGTGVTLVLPEQRDDIATLARRLGHSPALAAAGLPMASVGSGRTASSARRRGRRR